MDRPDKKNALTGAMYGALADGLERLQEDDDLRVGVLRSSGTDFCAGNDLFDFAAPNAGGAPVTRFLRALTAATKPLVAAVRGKAIGVGATMLLHCDVVHVGHGTDLRFPFVDLGLVPEAGSTLLLPELVGPRRAAQMLLLGQPLSGDEAVVWGIATDAMDPGDVDAAAARSARILVGKPPAALAATKRLLRGDPGRIVARQAEEGAVFADLLQGPEFADAVARFTRRS